mgnify:CR=1 FL=1
MAKIKVHEIAKEMEKESKVRMSLPFCRIKELK